MHVTCQAGVVGDGAMGAEGVMAADAVMNSADEQLDMR